MYKCNHCNITFSSKDDEGILTFRGKMYCKKCEEPVVEILDTSQAASSIHGAQATLISNSDNRITTNYYYGSGTPDEQIDTPYGPCRKSEARLCKQCRKWVPLTYFSQEKGVCYDCELKESQDSFEEGKSFFDMGFYDDAIQFFKKYESLCPKEKLAEVKTYIGRCYYELKDYKQALKYFVAASKSSAESNYYIAICYINGTGIAKDESKAMDLLAKSADLGSKKAVNFLKERQRRKELELMELHPIKENGKYGFADENGNVVIPCKWKDADVFHEGLARVEDDNDKLGFIDKTGNVVIPCKWEFAYDFCEGAALVEDDNYKWGVIDKRGEMVMPCKWIDKRAFQEGLASVQDENDKYGFIDKTGKIVIPCRWKNAWDFSEGLACVQDDNKKWGIIDKTGEIVIPCKWRNARDFQEGLACVQDDNKKWGFIDKTGKTVIPCKWKDADYFYGGLARVQDDNDKYGLIDKSGRMVIPCKWRNARVFQEGLVLVQDDNYKRGLFDKTGKIVRSCEWSSVNTFSDGLAMVCNGKYGFIDKTGKTIIPCKWKLATSFSDGLAYVKGDDDKWVYIDKTGKVVSQ